MKTFISAIIITISFTVVGAGCSKSASTPQPAVPRMVVDSFDIKLWQKPRIDTASI